MTTHPHKDLMADVAEAASDDDGLRQRAQLAEKTQITVEHPLLRNDLQQLSAHSQMFEQRLRPCKGKRDRVLQSDALVHQHCQRLPVFIIRLLLPEPRWQ